VKREEKRKKRKSEERDRGENEKERERYLSMFTEESLKIRSPCCSG